MPPPRKRGIGPVQLILLAFLLSAGLRLGTHGMAIAESLVSEPDKALAPEPAQCESPPDVAPLLASIKERQDQLEKREREMAERRLTLDQIEKRIAAEMADLKAAQEKLAGTLAIADSAAENDLNRLTEVYENMKPKNAAGIFETMDMSFAAGFLSRMKPQSAAGILSEMSAEKAYAISVVMAGRNARAPKE